MEVPEARETARRKLARATARRGWGTAAALVAVAVASACQVVGKYESFSAGEAVPPHPCDPLPSSKLDDKQLVTMVLSKPPNAACYWIDQTEVTVAEYSKFLAAVTPPVAWDSQRCAWKSGTPSDPASLQPTDACATTILQNGETDPFYAAKPIRCVDWCDAKAFCEWAGKDLCGGITNGSMVGPSDVPDQWGAACSASALDYTTGATAVLGTCNVGFTAKAGDCYTYLGETHCGPVDVGKFMNCVSTSGALDMIGNVSEWVLDCGNGDGGPQTRCQHRGGSFDDDLESASATCFGSPSDASSARERAIGFRCCAALNNSELSRVTK